MLAAALFFVLAIGAPWSWLPWTLLHHLPIFSWERMPERFLILFVLAASVIAAYGADFLAAVRKPFGAILAVLLLLGAVADAWMVSRPNMNAPVDGTLGAVSPTPQFVQRYEDPWSMLTLARGNIGALHCNESLDFHEVSTMKVIASNQPGYRGEHYLLAPGSLVLRRWTPDALSYDVVTPDANVAVINQNYDSNWRLAQGRGVFSQGGLIAVRVPAGAQRLRLVYRSDFFRIGAAISLLTCLIALALWRREQRRVLRWRKPLIALTISLNPWRSCLTGSLSSRLRYFKGIGTAPTRQQRNSICPIVAMRCWWGSRCSIAARTSRRHTPPS